MRHTLYNVECLSFPMFMRAFNLLIKYFVHNIVSWVEQEDSRGSGGGAVWSAVLWLAQAASHWSVSPSSGSDWLTAVTRPAPPVTWPGVNTGHTWHTCLDCGHVCDERMLIKTCVSTCQTILSSVTPCQRDKNMSVGAAWVLFVYLSSGRAGPESPEGS